MRKGLMAQKKVEDLLDEYKTKDPSGIGLVRKFLESKGNDWDTDIKTKDEFVIKDLSLLLAYEYCIATEIITNGRISFEKALEKLSEIDKFRLGEPKSGDELVIYGKSVDDPEAISIVSDKYDEKRKSTGAQYANYVDENGKLRSAVFIFGKKLLKDGSYTTGMDFDDLSEIRQTVFHEWNHNAEREKMLVNWHGNSSKIQRKYMGPDGKVYTNYEVISQYRLPIFKKGEFVRMSDPYRMRSFERVGISTGLSTREEGIKSIIMHNQITEGFVEMYARKMVLAIDPNAKIDEGKYYEHTEMAKRIDSARDKKKGIGQTATDFLSHSIVLKNELETIIVDRKKDGLHYIADYADASHEGKTNKKKIMAGFDEIAKTTKLTDEQIKDIQSNSFWKKTKFNPEDVENIMNVFSKHIQELKPGSQIYEKMTKVVNMYISSVEKEREFFDEIPRKLKYKKNYRTSKEIDDSDEVFEY